MIRNDLGVVWHKHLETPVWIQHVGLQFRNANHPLYLGQWIDAVLAILLIAVSRHRICHHFAAAAIFRAISDGFPTPDGGRLVLDRDFMTSLAALAKFAEKKLSDVRTNIGNAALKNFAIHVIGLPEKYPIFAEDNLDDLANYAPVMSDLVKLRQQVRNACLAYIKEPTQEGLAKINKFLANYSLLSTKGIDYEIDYFQSHLKSNMTKEDWNNVRAIFRANLSSLKTQVAHLLKMIKSVRSNMTTEQFLSTDSARALLEGRLSFPILVEARVHGMTDADVDPALDDSRLISSKPLGSGNVNTVNLLTYQDGTQYVFKPEAPGRQMMEKLNLSKDYSSDQQVSQLNLATQSVANALGLDDTVPKCSVGAHNGNYGLFMEKVPGQESIDFANGKPPASGSLTAKQVRDLKPEQYGKVLGGILRGLNRLEWLDLITGQGDRHAHNYFIDVREDLSVSIKGIDNDQCFPAYRTGLRTYVLNGKNADRFRDCLKNAIDAYLSKYQKIVRDRIEKDPGYIKHPDGSVTLDTTKFQEGELFFAAQTCIGMHGCTVPDYIDEDLYTQLIALKNGKQRDALLADLATRLSPAALDSARRRLDEAIAHAEKLKNENKVIRNDDFAKRDVQNLILARELHAPQNPVKPVDGYSLSSATKLVRKATRQIHSFFVRDILGSVEKKGWFN